MIISELIKELEIAKNKIGDVEVYTGGVLDSFDLETDPVKITDIEYVEEHIELI